MHHSEYCTTLVSAGGKVLDVGSGRGKFLAEMAGAGFTVFGVEPSPEYRALTEQLARERGVHISLSGGEGEHLPFSDGFFDFVNCSEVTEHVQDPMKVCSEIFRVLKSGGMCYMSFHNRFGIYDYHYHLWGINWMPRRWSDTLLSLFGKQKEDSAHIGRQKLSTMHYYTFGRVWTLLSSIGFSVSDIREHKVRTCSGLAWPFALLGYRLLLRPLYFNTFHLLLKKA